MATPIPENKALFSIDDVVRETGGALHGDTLAHLRGVTTDTRGSVSGKLFVALRGEHFDGHRFAADAVRAGAAAVLVERDAEPVDAPMVVVSDTLAALGALARAHRRRWRGALVAVAGSAGKTTTRSTIAAALEALFPGAVHTAAGNLNNRIGVPMVLLGLLPHHRAAVVEIGTNRIGEVETLTRIAEPELGVLTLVDIEHSEGLGSLDSIEEEEGALLRGLSGGVAVANADDPRALRQLGRTTAAHRRSYGTVAAADYRIVRRDPPVRGISPVHLERPGSAGREALSVNTSLVGLPGALAVAAAVAVADAVHGAPVDAGAFARAFSGPVGEPGRLCPIELGDRTLVVDDSYNANPASVRASIEAAREIASARNARLVLVIGEMRELGSYSHAEHDALGAHLAETGAAALFALGGEAERFVAPARARGMYAEFYEAAASAADDIARTVVSGDVVLVKASRGVRAEQVVEALIRQRGRAA